VSDSSVLEHQRSSFAACLAALQRWLDAEQIPYAVLGSVAVTAWTDEGTSLAFNRPGARNLSEAVPDIDLLVPRVSVKRVKQHMREIERDSFPVHVDTFWPEFWIDFRPGSAISYLTHGEIRVPVPTSLFSPSAAPVLGESVAALDPRVLLFLYRTLDVVRRKDAPRIAALTDGLLSGALASRFTDQDCEVITVFAVARRQRYPLFIAAKRAWAVLTDALPPQVTQAINHYAQPVGKMAFRLLHTRRTPGSG
ncbi:MAG: hypothetical protein ACRDNS_25105, partial [Trebonia sp.]